MRLRQELLGFCICLFVCAGVKLRLLCFTITSLNQESLQQHQLKLGIAQICHSAQVLPPTIAPANPAAPPCLPGSVTVHVIIRCGSVVICVILVHWLTVDLEFLVHCELLECAQIPFGISLCDSWKLSKCLLNEDEANLGVLSGRMYMSSFVLFVIVFEMGSCYVITSGLVNFFWETLMDKKTYRARYTGTRL
jgi:hypothetical protein